MPTVCDLRVELRRRGHTGFTGLDKAGLEALLKRTKQKPKKAKRSPPRSPRKKAPNPSPPSVSTLGIAFPTPRVL